MLWHHISRVQYSMSFPLSSIREIDRDSISSRTCVYDVKLTCTAMISLRYREVSYA